MATTEGKLKAIVLVCGFLLLILALMVGALQLTSTPLFCQSCHEMRPEYVTWKASAHNKISCVDCHIEPGAQNFVKHKLNSFKQIYDHFTGNVLTPISLDIPIKDAVCERCHSTNRVVTPTGDIQIPHRVHKQNGVTCVTCHSAVVHANISEAGFTADGNWTKWPDTVGKAYVRHDFMKFSMTDCLKCHKEQGKGPGPDDCKACHTKLVKPASHLVPNFLNGQHGQMALQDVAQCDKCHQVTHNSKTLHNSSDNPAVVYARTNDFCTNCHMKSKPARHGVDWRKAHGALAAQNKAGCLVCHDESKPVDKGVATITYCYQCHVAQIHSQLKLNGHPRYNLGPQPELTRYPCLQCHTQRVCLKCHYVPGVSQVQSETSQ